MIFSPKLRRGDLVALVSPASPLQPDQPVEEIARAVERLGLRVRIGDSCRGEAPSGYGAATAACRAADINSAFRDPAVGGIWCTRGGSTSASLLERLDYRAIAAHPKAFIGFSDVTSLHLALARRCGMVTFHGPTANRALSWGEEDFGWRSLWAALTMGKCLPLENPPGETLLCLRPGRAWGPLVGGNLTLVAASMGTPWQVDARGRILFLEDVGEAVYATERALVQLQHGGIFHQAAGVLLGPFTRWRNDYQPDYGPLELMADFFADYPKPVVWNVRSAHVSPMVTLPLGAFCRVDGDRGAVAFFRGRTEKAPGQ